MPVTPVEDLDTPALLIDLDVLDVNIEQMAAFFRGRPAHLRPHVKTHKLPPIALRQVAAGAPGVCAAKVGEAEAMVEGGISDVLVANEVVGPAKIERLVCLAEKAQVSVAVDHANNVDDLSLAAHARGVTLGVLVDVDVGMGRCGVSGAEAAMDLARTVVDRPGLEFRGLMGYEGHVMGVRDPEKRAAACRQAMLAVTAVAAHLRGGGIPVAQVSAGGTMTYDIAGAFPGVTEIQAGSYVLMDTTYQGMGSPFRCALSLLATVMSVPRPGVAITDAGSKVLTSDLGLPEVKERPDLRLAKLSEEHGRLSLAAGTKLRLGQKVELLPSHCCTTVNLHDRAYAVRGGRVEEVWAVTGRGRSQ